MGTGHGHGPATREPRTGGGCASPSCSSRVLRRRAGLGAGQRARCPCSAMPGTWRPTSWPSGRPSSRPDRRTAGHHRAADLRVVTGGGVRVRPGRAAHARGCGVHRHRRDRPDRRRTRGRLGPRCSSSAPWAWSSTSWRCVARGGAADSLNVKGAYLEVVADTWGRYGRDRRRPARLGDRLDGLGHGIGPAIAVFVAVRRCCWAVRCSRCWASTSRRHRARRGGGGPARSGRVVDVHDLHLWTLTSGHARGHVHLACDDDADPTNVLTEAAATMRERCDSTMPRSRSSRAARTPAWRRW